MTIENNGRHAQGEALPKIDAEYSPVPVKTLTELLPVLSYQVGDALVKTTNARELHAFLNVGRDFSTWIQDRIAEYGFIEGRDYVTTKSLIPQNGGTKTGRGGDRRSKEYHLALGMGKELAMVARNEEGRRARRYFIDCESRLFIVAPEQQAAAMAHWQAQREVTKDYHGLMCRALLQARTDAGKETKAHHYSNELNMLNRLVLGVDAKHWSEQHGGCREVRQHMSSHQLELIAYLERSNTALLDAGMLFAERKARLAAMLAAQIEREGRA